MTESSCTVCTTAFACGVNDAIGAPGGDVSLLDRGADIEARKCSSLQALRRQAGNAIPIPFDAGGGKHRNRGRSYP